MTEAERVADEHISYRRSEGMPWVAIGAEARECLRACGLSMAADMRQAWAIERAFALAWEVTMMQAMRGVG